MFGMQIWKANPHFDCNLKTPCKQHYLGGRVNGREYLTLPEGREVIYYYI